MIEGPTLRSFAARIPRTRIETLSANASLIGGTLGVRGATGFGLGIGHAAPVIVPGESLGTDADHGAPGNVVQHFAFGVGAARFEDGASVLTL